MIHPAVIWDRERQRRERERREREEEEARRLHLPTPPRRESERLRGERRSSAGGLVFDAYAADGRAAPMILPNNLETER